MKAFRRRFCCVDTVSQCFKHFLKPFSTIAKAFLKGTYPLRGSFRSFRIVQKLESMSWEFVRHAFWKRSGGWCMHDFYVIHNTIWVFVREWKKALSLFPRDFRRTHPTDPATKGLKNGTCMHIHASQALNNRARKWAFLCHAYSNFHRFDYP